MSVLFTNPLGIVFERIDYKKRSKVKVYNNVYTIATYRFNNIPCFESPYISWKNLDQCGGWLTDGTYLRTAVQNGTKLLAGIVHPDGEVFESTDDVKIITRPLGWRENHSETHICRKGTLAEYYDLDAVFNQYQRLGIPLKILDSPNLLHWFYDVEISTFATEDAPFNYKNVSTVEELVCTGLLLGYPLESTVSIIEVHNI